MDEIRLSMAFDLDEIRRSTQEAASVIMDELQKANISPAAFQMYAMMSQAGSAQQSTQAVRQTAQAAQQMASTAQQMSSSVQNHAYQTSQAVNAAQQAAQAAKNSTQRVTTAGTPMVRGRYGDYSRDSHVNAGRMTHTINTLSSIAQAGGSDASLLRGAGSMLAMAGPYGQVAQAALNFAAIVSEREQQTGMNRIGMFRAGGNEARNLYHELTNQAMAGSPTRGWQRGSMQELGLTNKEVERLLVNVMHQTGKGSMIWDVAKLESGYGLGGAATGLLGAVTRSGGEADRRALAQSIGIYFAQGLERSRVGESLAFMTRYITSAHVAPNLSEVGKTAEFIGGMGPGYKGDTDHAMTALSGLRSLASGEGGGASRMFAMRAAGLGSGKSYWEATLEMSKGLDQTGSNITRRVLAQYADRPLIKNAWMAGDRAKAAGLFSMLTGGMIKPYMAEHMLDSYYGGHGARDVTDGRDEQINAAIDNVRLPEQDRKSIDDENRKSYLLERDAFFKSSASRTARNDGSSGLDKSRTPTKLSEGVSSVAEFRELYGTNTFGQHRNNQIVGGKYVGGQRTHESEDINLPPGSPVYAVVGGRVKSVGKAMADAAYGYTIEIEGEDGRTYKYTHLQDMPSCSTGDYLPSGTLLGVTVKAAHFPGGSKSHLDFQIRERSGRALNPYSVLKTEQINRLVGAVPGKNSQLIGQNSVAGQPGGGATFLTGPPTLADFGYPSHNQQQHSRYSGIERLEIIVKDHRVSVTRAAGRAGPSGPSQLFTSPLENH